jgi:TonB family protein
MKILAQVLLTFVLNAVWQVALIALFAFLCARLMRRTPARLQHRIWVAALMVSLFVPAWSCALRFKDQHLEESNRRQPMSARAAPVELVEYETVESQPQSPGHNEGSKLRAPVHLNRNLGSALIILYCGFLLYQIARLLRAWRRTRAIVRQAYSFQPREFLAVIIERCLKIVNARDVRFLASALISVPITAGVLKPTVILPAPLLAANDHDLLTSAIGHELVHVSRRDYLLNLIYELVSLPLSFHPAARLIRANIKRTRELCCDERVANELVNSRQYARSLVRLLGAMPLNERMDTTIGINESDNLEERIMSLLSTRKMAGGRKRLVPLAFALLLTVPCLAAAKFGLRFDLGQQEQSNRAQERQQKIELQEQERAREELQRAARQLREQIRVADEAQRPALQAQLQEVERALTENQRVLQQYELTRKQNEQTWQQAQEEFVRNQAAREAQMQEARARLARLMAQSSQPDERQVEEIRRAQRELQMAEEQYVQDQKQQEEKLKPKEREEREKHEWKEKEEREKQEIEEREEQEREEENRGAGLAAVKWAKIPMTQAIQIATSKYPGAVLQCRLFGEREDKVFYQVVIATGEGDNQTIKYVWVSAIDGQIFKTEEKKKTVDLFGARLKAIQVPNPEYPAVARAAKVSGEVQVQITVDQQGNVIYARAVSGHPLLQASAVSAAREAKFEPTLKDGQPVKVVGILTYNFQPE